MHFLELAQFLHAPHLAGRKVKGYFTPRFWSLSPAVGVWALKPLFSHLHKNTKEPVFFLWRLALMILIRGKHITRAIGRVASAIWAQNRRDFQPNPSNGTRNVFAPHQNQNGLRHIINRFINSYFIAYIWLAFLYLVFSSLVSKRRFLVLKTWRYA